MITTFREFLNEHNYLSDNLFYHGSSYKIDKFSNLGKDGSKKTGGDEYGYGTYLTGDKNLAKHYARGGYVYTVKISNHLNFLSDEKRISKRNADIIRNIFLNRNVLDNHNNIIPDTYKLYLINNILKDSKNGRDLYGKIQRIFPISDKELSELMDANGIHGLVGNEGKETVVFNTDNIEIIDSEKLY